ncbi:hypothetical protein ALQ31_04569 [Pseudomonas amygdali pv. morsprunorum]|nr:hypothetical protein ALQ31_04569 [Pseudomonas amygdali pv. morsprunorum]
MPVAPIAQPLRANLVLMHPQRAIGHLRQQGYFPWGREQRIGVVGQQSLSGFRRVDAVVEKHSARIRRRAGPAVGCAFCAAVATEAGTDQVLVGIEPEACRFSEDFIDQQWNIQWNDLGIDLRQSADQLLIEARAECGSCRSQWRTAQGWRFTDIRQQPDHDVARTGLLQGLRAVSQLIGGLRCAAGTHHATLQEVVAASGQVIKRIGVGAKTVCGQVAGPAAQQCACVRVDNGGLRVDRLKNLVGPIAADCPVIAIRGAQRSIDWRRGGRQISYRNTEHSANQRR